MKPSSNIFGPTVMAFTVLLPTWGLAVTRPDNFPMPPPFSRQVYGRACFAPLHELSVTELEQMAIRPHARFELMVRVARALRRCGSVPERIFEIMDSHRLVSTYGEFGLNPAVDRMVDYLRLPDTGHPLTT